MDVIVKGQPSIEVRMDAKVVDSYKTVDAALSESSVNPVQNKVVTGELNKKATKTEVDAELAKLSEEIVKNMLLSEAFTVQSCTRDKYGDINSALITWADGVDGKIDIARNSDGTPNRIDMKYGTKWYILTIIRDGNGDVISSTLK